MASVVFAAAALLARPAGANLVVQFAGSDKAGGKVSRKIRTTVGQKVYFQVAQVNRFRVPLVALCRMPLLNVKAQGVLLPGKLDSRWLTAKCVREGTYHVSAHMAYLDPYTGRVCEVADTCVIVCEEPRGKGKDAKEKGGEELPPLEDEIGEGTLPDDGTGLPGGEGETPLPDDGGLVVLDPPTGSSVSTDVFQQGGGQQSGAGQQQNGLGGSQQQNGLGGSQQHKGSDPARYQSDDDDKKARDSK
jgi:hypothetical protein